MAAIMPIPDFRGMHVEGMANGAHIALHQMAEGREPWEESLRDLAELHDVLCWLTFSVEEILSFSPRQPLLLLDRRKPEHWLLIYVLTWTERFAGEHGLGGLESYVAEAIPVLRTAHEKRRVDREELDRLKLVEFCKLLLDQSHSGPPSGGWDRFGRGRW